MNVHRCSYEWSGLNVEVFFIMIFAWNAQLLTYDRRSPVAFNWAQLHWKYPRCRSTLCVWKLHKNMEHIHNSLTPKVNDVRTISWDGRSVLEISHDPNFCYFIEAEWHICVIETRHQCFIAVLVVKIITFLFMPRLQKCPTWTCIPEYRVRLPLKPTTKQL